MRKIIKIHRKMSKWMKCIENIFFKNLSFLIFGKCFEKEGKKLGYEKNILFFSLTTLITFFQFAIRFSNLSRFFLF